MQQDDAERNLERETTFIKKVATGQMQAVEIEDVEELFRSIDPENTGSIHIEKLRKASEIRVHSEEFRRDLLCSLHTVDYDIITGHISPDQLMQALLLGTHEETRNAVHKLKGLPEGRWVFRETLVEHLKVREEANENCKALPLTLLFFCVFFYLVTRHLQIGMTYELTSAVGNDLNTAKLKKKHPDSLWSLVRANAGAARISFNNKVVGGVRISEIPEKGKPLGRLCMYGTLDFVGDMIMTGGANARSPEPLKACHTPPRSNSWVHWPLNREDGMLHFSGSNATNAKAVDDSQSRRLGQEEIVESYTEEDGSATLAKPAWINQKRRLQYQVLTFNPQLNHYTCMRVKFSVLKSGDVQIQQSIEALTAQPIWLNIREDIKLERTIVLAFDAIFFLIYIFNGCSELFEMCRICHYKGCKKGLKMYWSSFWNLVDWFNIFMVTFIVIVYFQFNYLLSGLNQLYAQLPELDEWHRYTPHALSAAVGGMTKYEMLLNDLAEQAEQTVLIYNDLKWYISLFTLSSGLKFLKAFRANPKLNVVTQTVVNASGDLAHFSLVVFALLMAFVLVAHILFGSQVNGFTTPMETLDTCFFIMLGYVFDDVSHAMFEVGSTLGIIWAWVFNITMILLILNMVLAIIFDVYADVKQGAEGAPSLLEQTLNMLKEAHQRAAREEEIRDELAQDEEIKRKLAEDLGGNDDVTPVTAPSGKMEKDVGAGLGLSLVKPVCKGDDEQEPDPEMRQGSKGSSHKVHDQKEPRLGNKEKGMRTKMFEAEAIVSQEARTTARMLREEVQDTFGFGWTESKVYDALTMMSLHDEDVVTMDSLMTALRVAEAERPFIGYVIEQAKEGGKQETEHTALKLSDAMRLIGRIDANVRGIVEEKNNERRQQEEQLALSDEDAAEKAKNISMVEENFSRIEDAVWGLSHKVTMMDDEGNPKFRGVSWPPPSPSKSLAWS